MKRKQLIEFYDKWYLPDDESFRRRKTVDDYILEQNNTIFNDAREEFDLIDNLVNLSYLMASLKPVSDEEVMNCIKAMFILASEPNDDDIKRFVELISPGFIYLYEFVDSDFYKQLLIDNEITGDEKIDIGPIRIPISKKAIKLHLNRLNQYFLSEEDIKLAKHDFIELKLQEYDKFDRTVGEEVKKEADVNDDKVQQDEIEKKIDHLKEMLYQYRFFELPCINSYDQEQKTQIVGLLAVNDLPYQIALLQEMNFIQYVYDNYSKNKSDLYKRLSQILKRPERAIAGNIRSFEGHSKDRVNYTAYQNIQKVKDDISRIEKLGEF
ncbi:hypothetical protein [Draconibacterium orientale]|uniref:hypothetical protein n=1 Tax=Draconibacterium orientale TaxID=1168034 RepID=UPI002A0A3E26|nr:hypothetical protein [Draconibacterium orientale]